MTGKDRVESRKLLDIMNNAPTYMLHHLICEQYTQFGDALNDLDDALNLVYLFMVLLSEKRIKMTVTQKTKHLAASWGAYCATSSSVTKSFASVKGNVPAGVDHHVM
eukprot:15324050-Ditylum_brightwellii.AAC.1